MTNLLRSRNRWTGAKNYLNGREMEGLTLKVLTTAMQGSLPLFDEVIYHEPHSPEDSCGIDFTVTLEGITKRFGISLDPVRCLRSQEKHQIPQLYLTHNTTAKQIIEKVLDLF